MGMHWLKRPAGRARLLLLLPLMILSGCGTTTGSGGADVFCRVAQPIRWSAADTDETIRQAKGHNAVGRSLCGWR